MNSELLTHLPPAFILILGGLSLSFFQENAKRILVLVLPLLALAQSWMIPTDAAELSFSLAGFELSLLHQHSYTLLFATIFCMMAFAGGLFGLTTASLMESSASLIYAGAALGILFSGDLISLFLYWEVMAIASTVVILCGKRDISREAGLRYAYIHFIGGVLLLCGIISHSILSGSIAFTSMESSMAWMLTPHPDAHTISLWFMLIGVLINTGVPPLASWLPDSYPSASATGSVFLSAFTTKTSVFVLMVLFAGNELLVYIGLATIIYGLTYAMLQNNIRRTLSYGLISQIGVMVAAVGMGSDIVLLAVALVAFGHILYKGLWFMVAGAVIHSTNRRNAHELGGLWQHHKLLASIAAIATLAMIAPLTTGFIGKSLLSYTINQNSADITVAYYLITASAAGMFVVLLRLFWQVFLAEAPETPMKPQAIPSTMYLAMGVVILMIILPALPFAYEWLLGFAAINTGELPALYTIKNLISHGEIILFSAAAFLLLKPLLQTKSFVLLDVDWVYRVFLKRVLKAVLTRIHHRYWAAALSYSNVAISHIIHSAYKIHGPKGVLSRNWNISTTAMWSILLLGLYLILYYTA